MSLKFFDKLWKMQLKGKKTAQKARKKFLRLRRKK